MRHNWIPGKLDDVLRMAKIWLDALAGDRAADWGVPPAERTALEPLVNTAEQKLASAKSNERTQVITAECRDAFDALTAKMRFIKDRYFKAPPLTDADFTLLELNIPDTVHTRRGTPRAQMTAEIGRSGTAMLILKLIYAEGTEALADMHTDIEYQVRHGKFNPVHPVSNAAAGEIIAVPSNPLELPMVFTTGRRRENISYGNEDSGKTAFFDIRISNGTGGENEGYGPWCPIFSAVIP
ncbi:hypothetical protein FACS189461_4410 [Spirochaetia bacterium]|nr:hypothetical protein FACS189461_4410 [Spirochaetia bacterium]